jgi:hypothetical protein
MNSVHAPRITGQAVVIGYNPQGRCVYSEILDLSDYYDGDHVWDSGEAVRELQLQRVKGYLFDDDGQLDQEFESIFDLSTGIFQRGTVRYADGTYREL